MDTLHLISNESTGVILHLHLFNVNEIHNCTLCSQRYYFNLCQTINGGQPGCAAEAAVCRRRAGGKTETLGRVHSQTMELIGKSF